MHDSKRALGLNPHIVHARSHIWRMTLIGSIAQALSRRRGGRMATAATATLTLQACAAEGLILGDPLAPKPAPKRVRGRTASNDFEYPARPQVRLICDALRPKLARKFVGVAARRSL